MLYVHINPIKNTVIPLTRWRVMSWYPSAFSLFSAPADSVPVVVLSTPVLEEVARVDVEMLLLGGALLRLDPEVESSSWWAWEVRSSTGGTGGAGSGGRGGFTGQLSGTPNINTSYNQIYVFLYWLEIECLWYRIWIGSMHDLGRLELEILKISRIFLKF